MTVPSLPIPATTMAICNGVAATSNWPMADCAVSGPFSVSGSACRSGWARR
jgi:hypothetical protein